MSGPLPIGLVWRNQGSLKCRSDSAVLRFWVSNKLNGKHRREWCMEQGSQEAA